jgi:hypothetical protein
MRSISILAKNLSEAKTQRFAHDEAQALCNFLGICWTSHETELRSDGDAFDGYRQLLHLLARRQLPLAMELQERLRDSA